MRRTSASITSTRPENILKKVFIHTGLLGFLYVWGTFWGLLTLPELAFDKMLHLYGGYISGMIGVLFISHLSCTYFCEAKKYNTCLVLLTFFSALLIGIGWEMLEYYLPILRAGANMTIWDTVGDVIFDLIGGVFAGKRYQRHEYA